MNKNFFRVFVALVVCATAAFAQTEQTSNNQAANAQNSATKTASDSAANDSVNANQTNDDELPRFEIGAQFSSLNRNFDNRNGFGARFTYNFNRFVAAEAEANFYPGENFDGSAAQFVAGAKVGKRFSKFGVFGKARPGFLRLTRGNFELVGTNVNNSVVRFSRRTDFALDVGGVLEFYPTRNIVTRFDAGDTIFRAGSRQVSGFDANGNITRFGIPAATRHYFQFTAGIGFRF